MFTPKVIKIEVSAQHVTEAEARCARQREFIRSLQSSGQPADTANDLLAGMEQCLARLRETLAAQCDA